MAVEASSVNGHDAIVRSGGLKMVSGRKFPLGIGLDFAGVVAATGPGAGGYRAGDRVWGTVHPRQRHATGAAAEYVVVPADRIGPAPAGISAVDAASLVVAGTTALIALRDSIQLASGERVLVRGAAGGVGTAAVQLAHAMGGHVTALARDRHAAALRRPGRRPGPRLRRHPRADRAVRRHRRHGRLRAGLLPPQADQERPDGHRRAVGPRAGRDRGCRPSTAPAASAPSAPTPTPPC